MYVVLRQRTAAAAAALDHVRPINNCLIFYPRETTNETQYLYAFAIIIYTYTFTRARTLGHYSARLWIFITKHGLIFKRYYPPFRIIIIIIEIQNR